MVSIANVGGTDTFGTWITKSNQSFNELTLLTGVTGTTSTKSITGIANNLTVTGDSLFSGVHNLSNTTVTLPVVGNLTIPGGSSGYQLTTDGAGTISWAIPGGSTPSFTTTTGVIANTQFPGILGLSSNTYFTGANNTFASASVTLGAVGNVHITGGTTGFPLKTDGSGTLSWGTLGNTAIAAGAVGNTEIATADVTNTHIKAAAVDSAALAAGAVTFYKLPKNLIVTTTAGSNNVMLSPGDLVFANTRGGSHYVALNATPTNGDEIRIHDSEGCWAGNNLIVNSNSKTVMGVANFTGDVSNGYFTLVYSSTINDWRVINYG